MSASGSHGHPPYREMIVSAIASLGEEHGSSKAAIEKYIADNYSDLPSTHGDLVGTHLSYLELEGAVVAVVKHSYKLADAGASAAPPKRPRGRPPKNRAAGGGSGPGPQPAASAAAPKRPRGRPPKKRTAGRSGASSGKERKKEAAAETSAVSGGTGGKRKRGRPKKGTGTATETALAIVEKEPAIPLLTHGE